MIRRSHLATLRFTWACFALMSACMLFPASPARADLLAPFEKVPVVFRKKAPGNIDELKTFEDHLAKVVDRVMPAVVCVRVGPSFGSGVIVSKDGYILTAGHVSGEPDRNVVVYFSNGKQ